MQIFLTIALVLFALLFAVLVRVICKLVAERENLFEQVAELVQEKREEALKREQGEGLADHNVGCLHDHPTDQVNHLARREWIDHAYPLQQVTIKLQGTRHTSPKFIIDQLGTVLERLNAGDTTGHRHDDDFGYAFEYVMTSPGPSFFNAPAGLK